MDKRKLYRLEDFLKDDNFICYALDISSSDDANKWNELLKKYSDLAKAAEEAKSIINGADKTYVLPEQENEKLKLEILRSIEKNY